MATTIKNLNSKVDDLYSKNNDYYTILKVKILPMNFI